MGFLNILGKLLGVQSATSPAGKNWEQNLTEADIDALEKQGANVNEVRRKFYEREKIEQEIFEQSKNSMDYDKLNPYKHTPRFNDDFINEVALSIKAPAKVKEEIIVAPLVLASIVQANNKLYKKGMNEYLPMVLVFALDDNHRYDQDWLLQTADKISEMKESPDVPADCKEFIKVLQNDQSIFCFKLGQSLSGSADAWCVTYSVPKQEHLPNSFIPSSYILPFLVLKTLKYNYGAKLALVPSKYYTK